jgi:hypothetical protein
MRNVIDFIPAVLLLVIAIYYIAKIVYHLYMLKKSHSLDTVWGRKSQYADYVKIIARQSKNRGNVHTTH